MSHKHTLLYRPITNYCCISYKPTLELRSASKGNKTIMILDPSDPTGVGLFSKCARNHASKSKPSNRPASSHPTVRTTQAEALRRKSKPKIGFDKQTSREQREKMYKSGEVPAVGHYHFQTDRKPKLVWDILRAYSGAKKQQLQRQQRLQRSHYSQHMPQ